MTPWRALALLAALTLPMAPALAQQTRPPSTPALPGCTGRNFAQMAPAYLAVNDACLGAAAAHGDGQKVPATYLMTSGTSTLRLVHLAEMKLTASITAGQNALTISPCLGRTEWAGIGMQYRVLIPGAGTSGATQINLISSVTNAGCTINVSSSAVTTVSSALETITVFPIFNSSGTAASTGSSNAWTQMVYDQCGIAKGSATLTCPAGTFYSVRDVTQSTSLAPLNGLRSVIAIHDPTGTCADQVAQINSSSADGTTTTLDRTAACAVTSSNYAQIYFGPMLFTAARVATRDSNPQGSVTAFPGMGIEVPNAGSGSTEAVPVPLDTTISSVTDYLTATLAANSSHTQVPAPYTAYIRYGTLDAANVLAAGVAATTAANRGYRGLYWPPGVNTYMGGVSTAGTAIDSILAVIRCGEGRIIWPIAANWIVNTSACENGTQPIDEVTAFASQDLIQSRIHAAASKTINVAMCCDSWLTPPANSMTINDNSSGVLEDIIRRHNRTLSIPSPFEGAVGGQTWACLDPNGPDCGHGQGLPGTACASLPDFYQVDCTKKWLYYFRDYSLPLDLILMRLGGNDGRTISVGSIENVVQYTQSAAWLTAATVNPDIRFVIGSNAPQGSLSLDGWRSQIAAAGLVRSMADSGWFNSTMHNSGSIGTVEADAWQHRMAEGFDPLNIPGRVAQEILPPAPGNATGGQFSAPYYWTEPVWGFSLRYTLQQTGVLSAATFWSNQANGMCWSVGNGAATTPWLAGSGSAGALVPFAGGAFCVDYNTGTGNYDINRYLYRTVQTQPCAVANSGGGGAAVVTCTSAIVNQPFELGQVAVAGAGSSACPTFMGGGSNCLLTSILAGGVSADGKTVSLVAAAGTTFTTTSTKIMFYRLQPGDPVATGCAAHVTTSTVTSQTFWVYVRSNGAVGFSDTGQFQEAGVGCQWEGKMAAFVEDSWYPSFYFEDNATHAGTSLKIQPNGTTNYVNAWEQEPSAGRGTQTMTSPEESGLLPGYTGPFGGGGNSHPSSLGVMQLYRRAFENAEWNVLK